MATVKSHVFEGKMVHAIYSDVVDEALTAGVTAETIMAAMAEESGAEVPEMQELRSLNSYCKPVMVKSEESGESAEEMTKKYVVRAVLRYVPVSNESESL